MLLRGSLSTTHLLVAAAEGAITGAAATEHDLPINDYDKQSAEEITGRLKGFSQRELRKIGAYERKRKNRATKIAKLTGEEPWPGYDEAGVDAITDALTHADAETARRVRSYEREHKDRVTVIEAADARIDRK